MTRVPEILRSEARTRSGRRCEYCRLPEHASKYPFHAEHIIAVQHDGLTISNNLAWACFQCNTHKGPNIASIDPETGQLTPLFNPRQQAWNDHFEVIDGLIIGKSPVGRVTAKLLRFNTPQRIEARHDLIASGDW